jgi:GT2 family glycosyltransferase
VDVEHMRSVQATCEAYHGTLQKLLVKLEAFERDFRGREVPGGVVEQLGTLVRRLAFVPFCRGVLREMEGWDPQPVLTGGPPKGVPSSIVVVSHDSLDQTRRCLEALRAAAEEHHPAELIFVDNGSRDGTAEFLQAQADVHLIRNADNLGAPHARNQGLAVARGAHVVFMDSDVMVTRGWLGRLLYHAEVDARAGCVGCLSDRAGHDQQVALPGAGDAAAVRALAEQRASEHHRQFRYQGLLTSFLLLVRREVIETIGGFDETFSPWGFEDDDFTLRAHLAGFRNRVALDVFVRHEPYTGVRKATAHSGLLQRNWARFAAKWGLPEGAAYGNYEGLDALDQGDWQADQLAIPLEGQEQRGDNVLAWPDYADPEALADLLAAVADELVDHATRHLVLRIDPARDGPVEQVLERVESAYKAVLSAERSLNVGILDEPDPELAVERALRLCDTVSTSGSAEDRAEWLDATGLPRMARTSSERS